MSDKRKKARKWIITDWVLEGEDWKDLWKVWTELDWSKVRYSTFVMETGESGKAHVQAFLHFQRPRPLSGVKSFIGRTTLHAERVIDDDAAAHYCEKPVSGCTCKHCKKAREHGSVVAGPHEIGTRPEYGVTAQAPTDAVADMVRQGWSDEKIAEQAPWALLRFDRGIKSLRKAMMKADANARRDVTVILMTGAAGTGKSSWAYDEFGVDNIYSPNLEGNRLWFDDYAGEKVLLLDDFRGGSVQLHNLLKYMDGQPKTQLQIKGGHVYAAWDTVVITSNTEPQDWYYELLNSTKEVQLTDEHKAFWRRVTYHVNDVEAPWTPEHRSNAFNEKLMEQGWARSDQKEGE